MKIPRASTYRGIRTDQHPSFDTLDEMIAWAVEQGATHMSVSNYHDGAFFRAKTPNAKKSHCSIKRFNYRYDWDFEADKTIPLPNGSGWYCDLNWSWGDSFNLEPHDDMYPFFPIGYTDSDKINKYLNKMREIHDYRGKKIIDDGDNDELPSKRYYLSHGTVQATVQSNDLSFYVHFGRAEYDRNRPVISRSIRDQAQPIVDKLNNGNLTEDQAKKLLEKIWF